MTRLHRLYALVFALLVVFAAPSAAAGVPVGPELPDVEAPTAQAADVPASPLCLEGPGLSLADLGALPMGHKEPGREIRCNEECDSFGDDCSHICGDPDGLCIPLSLASGLCFFCTC